MAKRRVRKSADALTLPNETAVDVEDVVTESGTEDESSDADKATREKDKQILKKMVREFTAAYRADQFYRKQALLDQKFRAGTWGDKSYQWVDGIQEEREANGEPCLTINRAPGFIHQVTNQVRNAHLRIHVNPVDDQGDPRLAEVLQGYIRNIEINSFSDRAIAMATDKQAEQGRGFIRTVTEWADDESLRQRIRIKREKNPLRIYTDASAQDAAYSDANFQFGVTDLDADAFEDQMGEKPPTEGMIAAFTNEGDETGDWFPGGKTRVVEYFKREAHGPKFRIVQLQNGKVLKNVTDEQLAQLQALAKEDPGSAVERERWVQPKQILWRKCTALKVYSTTVWPSQQMPWIPFLGDELEIDGERDYRGVIRDSKDAARVYNAEVSGLVSAVGRGLKSPVVGYRGQFGAPDSDMRKSWTSANRKPTAFLEVEPMDIDGKPAPFPQPITYEPPIQGTIMAIRQADEDYKTTAGFHDASLGERGPQESRVAIVARQRQDEHGSSHYLDNARFAMCALGRQLIELIRATADVPTVIRITGRDDKPRKVMVYSGAKNDPRRDEFLQTHPGPQPLPHPDGRSAPIPPGGKIPFTAPKGVAADDIFDLSVGEFDVEVDAGSDTGSRRQEAVEAMTALFKGLPPEYAAKFLDLYFMVMDFPMARQMAERAKKLMPPELRDEEGDGSQQQIPPEVLQKVHALQQQMQQLMQAYQAAVQEIKTEQGKQRTQVLMKREELASRERVETLKIQANLLGQKIDLTGEAALTLLQGRIDMMLQDATHNQESDLAALDASHLDADRILESARLSLDAASLAAQPAAGAAPAAEGGGA